MKQTTTTEALKFFEQASDTFANLAARWHDEHEYEDIADYMIPLKPIAKECGVVLEAMQKRPFGVKFAVGNRKFILEVKKNYVAYRRIA